MKNALLSLVFLLICSSAFSKVWTITNVNLEFRPDTLTINVGDTVKFEVGSMHVTVEVSQATWLENGTTPLPGFSLPGGGGMVLPAKLGAGIHYYVCTPHAAQKMKGIIIVKQKLGTEKELHKPNISIYPNPSSGIINISRSNNLPIDLEIFNLVGERVYWSHITEQNIIFELNAPKGVYFYKFSDCDNKVASGKILLQK